MVGVLRANSDTIGARMSWALARRIYSPWHRDKNYEIAIITTKNGCSFHVDTRSYIEWCLYTTGSWDRGSIALLEQIVSPGAIVLDVGANIGTYTIPLARRVGPSGEVHSFEPEPTIVGKLYRNLRLNDSNNVVVHEYALGTSVGSIYLYRPQGINEGGSSLAIHHHGNGLMVAIDRIDAVIERLNLAHIDLIKCDVEGADLAVLVGARDTLESHRPAVYVEVLAEGNETPIDAPEFTGLNAAPSVILNYLRGLDYDVWRNVNNDFASGWNLQPVALPLTRPYENWLALPRSRADLVARLHISPA
jgi:FkbM family methyltransferase